MRQVDPVHQTRRVRFIFLYLTSEKRVASSPIGDKTWGRTYKSLHAGTTEPVELSTVDNAWTSYIDISDTVIGCSFQAFRDIPLLVYTFPLIF